MYFGSNLMPNENICIEFKKTISVNGAGAVWAAEYRDYSGETIIVIPDNNYFVPKTSSKYLAQRPKGYEEVSAMYNNIPVYRRNILEVALKKIAENDIRVYTSEYYIPKCAIKNGRLSVFLRPSKYKNQFALIWVGDDRLRSKVFDHIYKNIPHAALLINKSDTITIEGAAGMNMDQLEENIIKSMNTCIKG